MMKENIKKVVTDMLDRSVPIVKAEKVVQAIREKDCINVTCHQVKTVMKDDMGLAYRIAKKVPV